MKKFANIAFLLCLAAAVLGVPAWTIAKSGHNDASYFENRALAKTPELTAERFWSGEYCGDWETWYSDHAPGRTTLLTLDTALQMDVLKRPVVNDVIVTQDVLLPFLKYAEWDTDVYREKAAPIADRFEKLGGYVEDYGGTLLFVGMPEQSNYFYDKYPENLDNRRWNAVPADDTFFAALTQRDVDWLDMRAVYEAQGRPDGFYSAVDHHFTYSGAFAAYQAVMDEVNRLSGLNAPVLRAEDVDFRELPNPYLGSRSRKLYDRWETDEHAAVAELKTPIPFTRRDNGEPVPASLYVLPENETRRTTYDLYMGGDKAETVIATNRPELPDALVIGDSFTNALETLLYASFDETRSLDLRHYDEKSVKDYLADYRPDVVLCVRNDTFFYTGTGNGAVWD